MTADLTLDDRISQVRAAKSGFVAERLAGEAAVRQLLDDRAGALKPRDVETLLFNLKRDRPTPNRFPGSFQGIHQTSLTDNLDRLNGFLSEVWDPSDDIALAAADGILRDKGALPNAGQALPSALLYIRDPARWAPVTDPIKRGAKKLGVGRSYNRNQGIAGVERWSRAVHDFCAENSIQIQEADAVFVAADQGVAPASGRAAAAERVCGTCFQTLGSDQFDGANTTCNDCLGL